ncbi:phenylacetic acid degradation bifunctional protein PaaZ [Gordonia liuliyuniae]|uniref:Phenylacetic acid degradation bifunctional protein PaaZ n=1 Tax=Gordonia liuliyuniae TaxID=2911517 RepID=A0ABS9IWH3_9ACTN|nr:phenylacetic acid degradation bifunctional protein PaaZ [Gordonia liuliyuniae]MCF8589922.1 phenylacetic acid degradation bifunctional protein PaaZ [Gordonia liuliyuniae]
MVDTLPSYLAGEWRTGAGDARVVRDAVTGAPVTEVAAADVDFADVLAYARDTGGNALRAMTFTERSASLKAAAAALSERKDELYELSAKAGSTRADAKVDVDGGFGTALVYAGLGRKGLPDGTVIVDDPEPTAYGKHGLFLGQHILTSRLGVAVQINAFNFPVWGMLEKLAPAVLAGVPTLAKAATPTAYVAEHAVRIIVESGALPDGALQFVAGPVNGLLDLLDGQDSVGFTGSASTAAGLRSHPSVVGRSVRFTAEADSLNASVLGPDAAPGTPEFDLYVDQVVTEMTTKAGQKCTAIRRAFVPSAHLDAVQDAVAARLADVVVGAPGADGVTMGALVGTDQRDDVRAKITELAADARIVAGDPTTVDVVGADPEIGAFLAPILLRGDETSQAAHYVEAFGPVSTLLPYDGSAADVIAEVARGQGSLAASVVSGDADFARATVLGIAAHHGRVLVVDRDSAPESTGHGIPMPQLVHGGPGRAGGGEEEGGLRAVHHHMQRTAVQAGPDLLRSLG